MDYYNSQAILSQLRDYEIMSHADIAFEASTDIPVPDPEATWLTQLTRSDDPDICATVARRYVSVVERKSQHSLVPDSIKPHLDGAVCPTDSDAPRQLYALLRALPLQNITKNFHKRSVVTALNRSVCDPPQSDGPVHINFDLIKIYLSTLAQAVVNAEPVIPGAYYQYELVELTANAFKKALQWNPHSRSTGKSVQSVALNRLSRLSVSAEELISLTNELEPNLQEVRNKSDSVHCQQMAAEIIDRTNTDIRTISKNQATFSRDW